MVEIPRAIKTHIFNLFDFYGRVIILSCKKIIKTKIFLSGHLKRMTFRVVEIFYCALKIINDTNIFGQLVYSMKILKYPYYHIFVFFPGITK